MSIQQLRIDIKSKDGITKELYDKICKVITDEEFEVMDDEHAPYTEDMMEQYKELQDGHRKIWIQRFTYN